MDSEARLKAPSATVPELDYLRTIEARGVRAFLRNGEGLSAHTMFVDEQVVPIVASDGRRGKPSLFSARGHYLEYPIHEIAKSSRGWTPGRLRTVLAPLTALLWLGRADRVVYVNHWLFNGSPPLRLDRQQLGTLLDGLRTRYPGHALVFSGIVPELAPHLAGELAAMGGLAVQSRIVHVLDPARSSQGRAWRKVGHTRRADAALLKTRAARRIDRPDQLLEHVERIQELYAQTYLDKHPGALNPQYETAFFELLLRSSLFTAKGWLGDGGILEAFNIQHAAGGIIDWSVCGHDTRLPTSCGWFRLVAAQDVELAMRERWILNWGAGNAPFKRYRGAESLFEYDIVFCDHLGASRRLPWQVLQHGRALKNGAPRVPAVPSRRSVAAASTPLGPGQLSARPRVALITSNPLLAGPLLEQVGTCPGESQLEIPLAIWLRPSMHPFDRLQDLLGGVRRQAIINHTTLAAQLLHHVTFRLLTRTAKHDLLPRSIELLHRGRCVVEGTSGNADNVVYALRGSGCAMGVLIGGDVLTRRTLETVGLPLLNVHLSDPSFVRGLPPVVWEILDHRDSITLTLHQVTMRLDAGGILLQREMPIVWGPTLAETLRRTRHLASIEIARLVVDGISRLGEGAPPSPRASLGPLRTIPRCWDSLRAERICRERHGGEHPRKAPLGDRNLRGAVTACPLGG